MCILSAFYCLSYQHYSSTNNVDEVIETLSKATPDDFIVVDVDEVLITLKDSFLKPAAYDSCNPIYFSIFGHSEKKLDWEKYGEWISQLKSEVVNPKLISAIQKMQLDKIKCIALTRLIPGAGPCGKIPSMEDMRFNELKQVGIDFTTSFEFSQLEFDFEPIDGRTPLFKDGILYARPYRKGVVLTAFLKKIGFFPKKVFFVDNDQSQVNCVGKSLLETEIAYEGICYFDQRLIRSPFNIAAGKFQFDHFVQTNVWLDDDAPEVRAISETKESTPI